MREVAVLTPTVTDDALSAIRLKKTWAWETKVWLQRSTSQRRTTDTSVWGGESFYYCPYILIATTNWCTAVNQEAVSFILAWDFLPACAKQQGFSHGQNNIIFILEWNKFLKRANRWGHQQQELLLLNQVGKWDVTPSHYLLPRLHINRAASCYKCIHNSCFQGFFTQAVKSVRINLFSCIMGLVGLINVAKIKRQGLNIKEFSLFLT